MIFARLSDAEKYFGVVNGLEAAVNFINNALENGISEGRHEISDGVYAVVSAYTTKSPEECRLEAHRVYADVQALISGKEAILVRDLNGLTVSTPYSPESDVEFFEMAESSKLLLEAGSFTLLLPEDAHAPGIALDAPQTVKKIVVKIRI